MSPAYRIVLFISITVCLRAQTVSPLVITTTHTILCHNTSIPFEIQGGDSLTNISYSMRPTSTWTIWPITKGDKFTVTTGNPGTFSLYVNATGPDGSARTGSTVLAVARKPEASFNAQLNSYGFPDDLILTNYSTNYSRLEWHFDDGSIDTATNLVKSYNNGGSHRVDLFAFAANGCRDTASYAFHIADSSGVTLPNVFTPNDDGTNDVYRPIARGILHLSGRIYNREQIMVHKWDKVNGFWDGRTTSGEPCPDGVYMIVVDAIGFDNTKYTLKGHITLVR